MTPAVFDLTTVDIAAADYLFRATASVLKFPGFTKVYQESKDTEEEVGPGQTAAFERRRCPGAAGF